MTGELDDDYEEVDGSVVRPFMLTRGRTRSAGVAVVMESLVDQRPLDEMRYEGLEPVQKDIWELTRNRLSAAEISAHLKLPLGTVCVLVGDMAGLEFLEVHKTASPGDVDLVRRLIDGVRAL